MKRFNKIKLLLIMLASAMLLTSCKKELTEADAQEYVEACFKASLEGDVDDYAEVTGKSKKDVKKMYQESLDSLVEQMSSIAGTGEEFPRDFVEVCKELLASAKYEVGKAKKDKDGNFIVEVKAYPSDVMTVFLNNVSQSAAGTDIGEVLLDALKQAVEEQSYGDAVNYEVAVTKASDGKYSIDSKDANEVVIGLFAEMDTMFQASGKDYGNEYLNWTKLEWEAASEDEKSQCCLAVVQYLMGYTDEEMVLIDMTDANAQTSIQQMKDGINMSFSVPTEISIGDYAELVKSAGGFE